eukprot:7385502-Prymnesium_polylepis.1
MASSASVMPRTSRQMSNINSQKFFNARPRWSPMSGSRIISTVFTSLRRSCAPVFKLSAAYALALRMALSSSAYVNSLPHGSGASGAARKSSMSLISVCVFWCAAGMFWTVYVSVHGLSMCQSSPDTWTHSRPGRPESMAAHLVVVLAVRAARRRGGADATPSPTVPAPAEF